MAQANGARIKIKHNGQTIYEGGTGSGGDVTDLPAIVGRDLGDPTTLATSDLGLSNEIIARAQSVLMGIKVKEGDTFRVEFIDKSGNDLPYTAQVLFEIDETTA